MFPNALAGALAPFPEMAGTASSVTGCIQMGTGAMVGAGVGRLLSDSPTPMFAVITATTLTSMFFYYAVVRRAEHEHL